MMRLLLGFVAVVMLFLMTNVSPSLAQQASNVTITYDSGMDQLCTVERNCFNPTALHVMVNTTVIWKNVDRFSHTVTSGNPYDNQTGTVFDSGLITPEKEFSFTFKDAGTYQYFCEIHPWMRGEIDVASINPT